MEEAVEESCARLALPNSGLVFVKATWFSSHFNLSITDGLHAWTCNASEEAVANRAAGWDETVGEYIERVKRYLGHQQSHSSYHFVDDGDHRKLSWTMEKLGTKLEAKWKCEKARNTQSVIREVLDFLMDSNIKLSEELVRKTVSFERMQVEAEKCLKQAEAFKNVKQEFEVEIYKKFVAVLNSKKAKLRELQEKLARLEPAKESDHETEDDLETDIEDAGGVDANNSGNVNGDVKISDSSAYQTIIKNDARGAELAEHDKIVDQGDNVVKSSSNVLDQPPESAADLLGESTYVSAPKRRRRL